MVLAEATKTSIIIYNNGKPAIIATKFGDFIKLAKEALEGLIRVPDPMNPQAPALEWVDHKALLRLSAEASLLAAETYT